MRTSPIRSRIAWLAFSIVLLLQISPALAGGADPGPRVRWVNLEVNFIKWITPPFTPFPAMAGFVGGDVTGAFKGQALSLIIGDTSAEIEATYQAGAGDDFFVAQIKGRQDFLTNTAVLNGVVTQGPMKGARAHVEYDVIAACGQIDATVNGECYLGTIRIFGFVAR